MSSQEHQEHEEHGGTSTAPAPRPARLVVVFDVTGLPEHEVDSLAFEAQVQAETSDEYTERGDGHPGEGHRGVPVVGAYREADYVWIASLDGKAQASAEQGGMGWVR